MLKFINKKRNQKGFTLIELVVVIAILGVLAAIALPRLTGAQHKAAASAHNSNVTSIESAAEFALANGVSAEGMTVKTLVTAGYLSSEPLVPLDISETVKKDSSYEVSAVKVDGENVLDVYKITVTPGKIKE